jgi:hypothetical protein
MRRQKMSECYDQVCMSVRTNKKENVRTKRCLERDDSSTESISDSEFGSNVDSFTMRTLDGSRLWPSERQPF